MYATGLFAVLLWDYYDRAHPCGWLSYRGEYVLVLQFLKSRLQTVFECHWHLSRGMLDWCVVCVDPYVVLSFQAANSFFNPFPVGLVFTISLIY